MPRNPKSKMRPRRRFPLRRHPKANQTSGAQKAVKHYARITEVVPFTAPQQNNEVNYLFNINQFVRATAVAKNFKYYRAKRVVWTLIPEYNTFQYGGGAVSAPQVSFIMNRTGDNTAWTLADYDAQGSVPMTFTKKRVIAYKPNLVQSIQMGPQPVANPNLSRAVGQRPLYDEWVATNVINIDLPAVAGLETEVRGDAVNYYGHSIYWSVTYADPTPRNLATIFCEVEWEFKDPLFGSLPTAPALVAVPVPASGEGVAPSLPISV